MEEAVKLTVKTDRGKQTLSRSAAFSLVTKRTEFELYYEDQRDSAATPKLSHSRRRSGLEPIFLKADAAALGNATVRALVFATWEKNSYFYLNGRKETPFIDGAQEYLHDNLGLFDGRTTFFYSATGVNPSASSQWIAKTKSYHLTGYK